MDKTSIFNVAALRQELILITLNEIITSLEKSSFSITQKTKIQILRTPIKMQTATKPTNNMAIKIIKTIHS